MNNITIEEIQELDNPSGLFVTQPNNRPTLFIIVDEEMKQVHPAAFTSSSQAQNQLYRLLTEEVK
jgi:hypothetical protein